MNCHSSDGPGYTPEPYKINYNVNDLNVLALGPELDVTFSIAKDDIVYPSQHIGNTNKPKTLEFLKEAIKNMQRITKIDEFDVIACDMHPHFFTTHAWPMNWPKNMMRKSCLYSTTMHTP